MALLNTLPNTLPFTDHLPLVSLQNVTMESKQLEAISKLHRIERRFGEDILQTISLLCQSEYFYRYGIFKAQATTYGLHYITKPLQEQQNGLVYLHSLNTCPTRKHRAKLRPQSKVWVGRWTTNVSDPEGCQRCSTG